MAEIDLKVSEEERLKFNFENRPVWPRVPTPCPVPECENKSYSTFKEFLIHWKQTHEKAKTVYMCSCGKMFANMKHVKAHLKILTGHTFSQKVLPNKTYIDAKEILPYQFGTKQDRDDMKEVQKSIASRKRKDEADKFMDARRVLCSISTSNICRDERVVERQGRLMKDTNLWDRPELRKRIDFKPK